MEKVKEESLLQKINKDKLPKHIAIIMDGNGRWAKNKRFLRIEGHRRGMNAVKEIVTACRNLGIKILTLYAFSTENWKRPEKEVNFLMRLLKQYLRKEKKNLMKNGIQMRVIGRISELPNYVQNELEDVCKRTKNNKNMILNLALNYSGRIEIIDTVRKLLKDIINVRTKLNISNLINSIDEDIFSSYVYTAGLPEPDLLVRTGGEIRISNFLLWQIAYTELWFTDVLWPDFKKEHLYLSIVDYQKRERRFGGV
ncbi:MAG: isoprenyl transferase [Candidatus Firestonebacteria bacterium]